MTYVAYLISGHKVILTADEFQGLAGKTGLVFVPSCGEIINLSSVSHVVSETRAVAIERATMTAGRLNDGTLVVRRFGRWVDAQNPELNLSVAAYPELSRDMAFTSTEWETLLNPLPSAEARREAALKLCQQAHLQPVIEAPRT